MILANSPGFPTTMDCFQQKKPRLYGHIKAIILHKEEYLAVVQDLLDHSEAWNTISSAQRAREICCLHITKEHKLLNQAINNCAITDLDKALQLLDLPRQIRQLRKKIEKIELENPHLLTQEPPKKKRVRPIDKLRRKLKRLESAWSEETKDDELYMEASKETHGAIMELIQAASVSGALSRKVCQRLYTYSSDFLEFTILEKLYGPWQRVSDTVHANPKHFTVPYFLATINGAKIPEDSFVATILRLQDTSSDKLDIDFLQAARKFPQIYLSYASLRNCSFMSSPVVVENLAQNIPLDTLIWHFEELYSRSKNSQVVLKDRLLASGVLEEISCSPSKVYSFGKLMERLLTFKRMGLQQLVEALKPVAENQLSRLKETWQHKARAKKVAVFGDASSSMQPAIDQGTIFSGMASCCLDAELSFFGSTLVESPHPKPCTVDEILEVCQKIRACGCTSLAAALWEKFDKKIWMDVLVMVTDEEENTPWNGYRFAKLLKEYKQKVNKNVRLVVVSVGSGDYHFRRSLEANGIDDTKFVTIDGHRPDNTKFGKLLGEIANLSGIQDDECVGTDEDQESNAIVVQEKRSSEHDDFVMVQPTLKADSVNRVKQKKSNSDAV